MVVPKGGSSCASCRFLGEDGKTCTNPYFQEWAETDRLPAPADQYCSDWFQTREDEGDIREAFRRALDRCR